MTTNNSKIFRVQVDGMTIIKLEVSGDEKMVDEFIDRHVQGTFGLMDKTKDAVADYVKAKMQSKTAPKVVQKGSK